MAGRRLVRQAISLRQGVSKGKVLNSVFVALLQTIKRTLFFLFLKVWFDEGAKLHLNLSTFTKPLPLYQ